MSDRQCRCLERLSSEPEIVYEEVESQLRHWFARKDKDNAALRAWQDSLRPEQHKVLERLDPFLLQAMLDNTEYDDPSYPHDLLQGLPITESLHIGGLGEELPGGRRAHGKEGLGGPDDLNR